MSTPEPPDRWYQDGLRFTCSRCGDCCRGPGYVWVTEEEIEQLGAHLEIPVAVFGREYLRLVSGRRALIDNRDGDCVFWRDGCSVYSARPQQCRTFPFWVHNLVRPQSWERTVRQCPGAGEGRLYSIGEIDGLRDGKGQTGSAPASDGQSD